jgi:hypothetical protein
VSKPEPLPEGFHMVDMVGGVGFVAAGRMHPGCRAGWSGYNADTTRGSEHACRGWR